MVFLVNQGKTWKQERAGGFLWSPQIDKAGHKNAGYMLMRSVQKGDYILHNKGGAIAAISIAQTDCYEAIQPEEVRDNSGEYEWNDLGFRIDTEYFDFEVPVPTAELALWAKNHPHEESCFQVDGKLKLRYLCNVVEEDARHIINEALKGEKYPVVKTVIYDALSSFGLDEDEYSAEDAEEIESFIAAQEGGSRHCSSEELLPQALTTTGGSSKEKPKRDPQVAANALENANYKCEYDPTDKTFLRKKSRKPYTEPHHLIPISRYKEFYHRVDIEENIVSLCSHCHNLLHYGQMEDKEEVLRKLYNERIDMLRQKGLDLSFEQLKDYYN